MRIKQGASIPEFRNYWQLLGGVNIWVTSVQQKDPDFSNAASFQALGHLSLYPFEEGGTLVPWSAFKMLVDTCDDGYDLDRINGDAWGVLLFQFLFLGRNTRAVFGCITQSFLEVYQKI